MEKTRREIAEEALKYINFYLENAGWTIDTVTLCYLDPLTGGIYTGDVAFSVQLGRDLSSNFKVR